MAMIKCDECKNLMSSNDKVCPHCGKKREAEFCCPKCGSKNYTFKTDAPPSADGKKGAKFGGLFAGKVIANSGLGLLLAPFMAMQAASSSDTQIQYICKDCGCKFTHKSGVIQEYTPPKVENFNPITAYISMIKKAFRFSGRSRRSEYWWGLFSAFVISALLVVLPYLLKNTALSVISMLFGFVHFFAFWSLSVRRMHDVGHGGGYVFVGMIPIIGWLIFYTAAVQDSDFGDNEYGPNPKGMY